MPKLEIEDKRITIKILRSLHEQIEKSISKHGCYANVGDFSNDAIRDKLDTLKGLKN